MQFDILIPTQERTVAGLFIDYVKTVMPFIVNHEQIRKVAKELVQAKYWESYECGDTTRQEYWRVVMGCFDTVTV